MSFLRYTLPMPPNNALSHLLAVVEQTDDKLRYLPLDIRDALLADPVFMELVTDTQRQLEQLLAAVKEADTK